MISYAQNFEDVMLARVFHERSTGFYIDIGAGDPVNMSVTKWFYDQGWSGINVEPNKTLFGRLSEARARDLNLNCGVGAERGRAKFWEAPQPELSTFDHGVHVAAKENAGDTAIEVDIVTLSEVIDRHAGDRQIDFLKIDVEGWENKVLQGLNLDRHRPTVLVIEAVFPETRVETHWEWEQLITEKKYKRVYFDGLNQFYLADEADHLAAHFLLPPNVFDHFTTSELDTCEKDRSRHLEDNLTLTATVERLQAELDTGEKDRAQRLQDNLTLRATVERLQADIEAFEKERAQQRVANHALTATVERLQAQLNASTTDLAQLSRAQPASAGRLNRSPNEPRDRTDLGRGRSLTFLTRSVRPIVNWWRGAARATYLRPDFRDEFVWCTELLYRHYLGRGADEDAIRDHVAALQSGVRLSALARNIEISPEAELRRQAMERELAWSVELLYHFYLSRSAEPEGMRLHVAALRDGVQLSVLARAIETSPEAENLRIARSHGLLGSNEKSGRQQRRLALNTLSDGEFVVALGEFLFHGRGALAEEVEHWKRFLAEDSDKRVELIVGAAEAFLAEKGRVDQLRNNPNDCWIMGTDRNLTLAAWEDKARELRQFGSNQRNIGAERTRQPFRHSGQYWVSAIASLYKGGRHIEKFLENITSQTIFDRSELIIIDADSPDNEEQIIAEYRKTYPNIVYKRINYRIGIYDAWNIGVEISRGRYLTNTNLDDLRRRDSFELQAATLERYGFVDVVYQDFFYNLNDSLSFEEIEQFGFKSELPTITPHNLLKFNSPHCAPMWRKALHAQVGLFDTSYRSAGDWEFWLRCLVKEKRFLKINTPHIAYFQNPNGISTRPDTLGIKEAFRIQRSYSDKLISQALRMSRKKLAEALGTQTDWDATASYYDVVQREICRLGARFRKEIEVAHCS